MLYPEFVAHSILLRATLNKIERVEGFANTPVRLLSKLIFVVAANAAAIWAATQYIDGVRFDGSFRELAVAAAILTALNFVVKPVLKMILGPIIILTLGLGLVLVSAIVIYILDLFSNNLTIEGIPALFYTTILISAVNFVVHLATKK